MSKRTLFIPAAGKGTRASTSESDLPKALITLGDLPAIARIIDLYPESWRIVIGVGYKAQMIVDSVRALYDTRTRLENIDFIETDSWCDDTAGLSQTILACKNALGDEPFIFHAVDSVVLNSSLVDQWSIANQDTLVTGIPFDDGCYRYIAEDALGVLTWKRDFVKGASQQVYVGIASIIDTASFWRNLESSATAQPEDGEALGLRPNAAQQFQITQGDWIDIGSISGIQRARALFESRAHILHKPAEALWFRDNRVIKVHSDSKFIMGRVERAKELAPYVPEIINSNTHTFTYKYVEGRPLSEFAEITPQVYLEFYSWLADFWSCDSFEHDLALTEIINSAYQEFYRSKTFVRVERLLDMYPEVGDIRMINGLQVKPISQILEDIDWQSLCVPVLGRVHGDLHAENIVVSTEGGFKLLDWRQDMAGDWSAMGDVYYDLAKLSHGFRLDHGEVAQQNYSAEIDNQGVARYFLKVPESKKAARQDFDFTFGQGHWDMKKVHTLEGLIFLNIACLHDPREYSLLLAMIGIETLSQLD